MAAPRTQQDTPPVARWPLLPVVSVIVLALVALCGVGLLLARSHSSPDARTARAVASPTAKYVIGRSFHYATIYTSLGALTHDADVAIVGVVTRQAGSGFDNGAEPFAYTDWTVSISSVAYDKRHTLASVKTITFRQSGGTVDGQQYTDTDDPLMTVGDHALFFLQLDVSGATVKPVSALPYRAMNGSVGRFPSVNGLITRNVAGTITLAKPTDEATMVSQVQALSA